MVRLKYTYALVLLIANIVHAQGTVDQAVPHYTEPRDVSVVREIVTQAVKDKNQAVALLWWPQMLRRTEQMMTLPTPIIRPTIRTVQEKMPQAETPPQMAKNVTGFGTNFGAYVKDFSVEISICFAAHMARLAIERDLERSELTLNLSGRVIKGASHMGTELFPVYVHKDNTLNGASLLAAHFIGYFLAESAKSYFSKAHSNQNS